VLLDPHTAVGCAAARDHRAGARENDEQIIVLSTAHPAKFSDIVEQATGVAPVVPERLARCLALPKQALRVGTALAELSDFLLGTFG
jgi:threonine synthase